MHSQMSAGGLGVSTGQESQQWEDQGVEWRRMKTSSNLLAPPYLLSDPQLQRAAPADSLLLPKSQATILFKPTLI